MPLNEKGLVVDIGGYNGDWSLKLLNLNPGLNFKIYEPVRTYFEESQKRFQGYGNVEVFNQAISSDGRKIQIHIDGPRSKLEICLLYTSPSPRDRQKSRMPSSA